MVTGLDLSLLQGHCAKEPDVASSFPALFQFTGSGGLFPKTQGDTVALKGFQNSSIYTVGVMGNF